MYAWIWYCLMSNSLSWWQQKHFWSFHLNEKCVSEKISLLPVESEGERERARPKINFYCLLWSQNDENFFSFFNSSENCLVCVFLTVSTKLRQVKAWSGQWRTYSNEKRKSSNIFIIIMIAKYFHFDHEWRWWWWW